MLPDGRTVACWEGGDPAGSVVLFHSGTPSGRLQAALGHEAALRAGVRLIVIEPARLRRVRQPPSGPGTGGHPCPRRPRSVRRRPLRGAGCLRRRSVPALATGLADQARVTAVGVAAGIGPWIVLDEPLPDDGERPLVERALAGDEEAVAGLATLAAEEFAWFSPDLTDEDMSPGSSRGCPPVRSSGWMTMNRVRWAADVRDALDHFDGYVRDGLSWGSTWDLDLGRLLVPGHSGTAAPTRWWPRATGSGFVTSCPRPGSDPPR